LTATDRATSLSRLRVGPRVASRTPAGWEARPYTRFTVEPAGTTIGAEIVGLSLAEALDAELHQQLNRALLEWKVLFFRDQHLTHEQHLAFARNWGDVEVHPFIRKGQPEAKPEVVRLERGEAAAGRENGWHSDVTWREAPSLGSILRAVEIPPFGGDTLWADMAAAYDLLEDGVKERIDGLVAVHDWVNTFGRGMEKSVFESLRAEFPPVEHPVVRTHPETGRKTLYVNASFTTHIVGLDADESASLLAFLCHQANYPEFQTRLRWAPGTIAFWDNRSTQHYASSDYWPDVRVMERVTVAGDRPN
jgi:taurine dioxygenase